MTSPIRFRDIKAEIRVLGIDDCAFKAHRGGVAIVVGVVFRGGLWLDGVMRTEVDVDGRDATEKIVAMVKASPHYRQLRVIMLDSITIAGFNIIDIKLLFQETKLPVIALTRERPKNEEVKSALKNLSNWEERLKIIEAAGELSEIQVRRTKLYAHIAGMCLEDAEKIVRMTSTRANFPEPLRVAHILASGLCEHPTNRNKRG